MLRTRHIGVVVPAAGAGTRMGGNLKKQFLELDGTPILVRTLKIIHASDIVDTIVVAVAEEDVGDVTEIVKHHRLSKIVSVVAGGTERQDSVWNGLRELRRFSPDIVLVHDAVRPFVDEDIIRHVADAAIDHTAALVAVCSKDTVKLVGDGAFVMQTQDRNNIWLAQTPQAFQYALLCKAFEQAEIDRFYGTDDAVLVERLGVKVKIVQGSYDNIKITTPEDLDMAHIIAQRRIEA